MDVELLIELLKLVTALVTLATAVIGLMSVARSESPKGGGKKKGRRHKR